MHCTKCPLVYSTNSASVTHQRSEMRVHILRVFGAYCLLAQQSCSTISKHHQVTLLQSPLLLVADDVMAVNQLEILADVNYWMSEQHLMQNHHCDVSRCHRD